MAEEDYSKKISSVELEVFYNLFGLKEEYISPSEWVSSIVMDMLALPPHQSYPIETLRRAQIDEGRKYEAWYYLLMFSHIKERGGEVVLDAEDEENNRRLNKIVRLNLPDIELGGESDFKILKNSFYESLDDGQKALLWVLNNDDLKHPHNNILLPDEFKTEGFYEYLDKYFWESGGVFYIPYDGSEMMFALSRMIMDLAYGRKFLNQPIIIPTFEGLFPERT